MTGIGHSFFPSSIQSVTHPSSFKSYRPHCPLEYTALQTHCPRRWNIAPDRNLVDDRNIDRIVPPSPSIELDSATTFFYRAYVVTFEIDHSRLLLDVVKVFDEMPVRHQARNPIHSTCIVSHVKPTDNPRSPTDTPNYKSVSGSNNPVVSQASPGFTSVGNDQAMPASTTKHAVVDDNDSSESINTSGRYSSSKMSYIEDESGGDVCKWQQKMDQKNEGVSYEMGKKYIYVVFKGRKTGVFTSWPECHKHVDDFPGGSYQKFNSTEEAYEVISSRSIISSHSQSESYVTVEENVSEKSESIAVMLFAFLFVFIFGVIVGKIV
ncbi:hypothetical protein Ddye_028214 [Dipteronia dyeriana]|uniref:Ribonuclease H n=1 Tax=Dipteronia dyeriana TaxID=168575 RepID=A0AAD9TQJ8_9ROSI|nr:hypothetical protein Ddye_028214 [Dipteronia dyeriana]